MSGDEKKCREAGCSGYLSKPVDAERLVRTVAEAIGRSRPPSPPAPAKPAGQPDPAAGADPGGEPIISHFPMDDPDFRDIAEAFTVALGEKLAAMRAACAARDWPELARLAHWLKGSGGTAGFDAFTAPARHLEQLAEQGRAEHSAEAIAVLEALARRIVVPPSVPASPSSDDATPRDSAAAVPARCCESKGAPDP